MTTDTSIDALQALRAYAALDHHDPAIWRRCLGPDAIQQLADADQAEVDGLILAAAEVQGAGRGALRTLHRAIRDARRSSPSATVVGMDGRPHDPEVVPTLTEALRRAGMASAPALSMPDGYELGPQGEVYELVATRDGVTPRLVSHSILCVTDRSVCTDGQTWLGVGWGGPRGWVRRVVPRTVLTRRPEAEALARHGAPVDSSRLQAVQRWLGAVEAASDLPTRPACESMGWVDPSDPSQGFVVGLDVVGADGASDGVEMVGAYDTVTDVIEGYSLGGTWEGWRTQVWDVLARHPVACSLALVSLVGPLLALIPEARPIMGDLGARSSTGKSVLIGAAASIWGCPSRTVGQWASTARGLEARGRWQGAIPLLMDDTKQIDDENGRRKLISMMHAYGDEGGRARMGATGQLEVQGSIRGVLITAGETPIATMAQDSQGAITRLLTVRRPPWEVTGAEGARVVESLRTAIGTHYGHAGRRYAAWLAERTPLEREGIRRHYLRELDRVRADLAGAEGPAHRMAAHVALLSTAATCAHRAWGVPVPVAAVGAAMDAVREAGTIADVATRAHETLVAYIQMHLDRMQGQSSDLPASVSLIGRWRETDDHPFLAAPVVEEVLERAGFDAPNVLDQMADRGLVVRDRRRIRRGRAGRPVGGYEIRAVD